MIRVIFYQRDKAWVGFSVSGHAGFDEYGRDIVCAGVTSAVQLACNGITEVLKLSPEVDAQENEIRLFFPEEPGRGADAFLQALHLHLVLLSKEYPDHIELIDSEVQ